jgi:hypothetical protein
VLRSGKRGVYASLQYEGGERRIDVVEFVTICRAIGVSPAKLLKALLKVLSTSL